MAAAAAAAACASSSPAKCNAEAASASSPFLASHLCVSDGGKDGALRSSPPLHQRYPLLVPVRALLVLEDPRSPSDPASYRILLAILAYLLGALVSAPSIWSHLNAPYLCHKDGIQVQRPGVSYSLRENPHAATTSWSAERRSG